MLALALTVVGTGCLEAKYRYVVSGAEKVSYRVPRHWATYRLPTGAVNRLSPDSPGDVQLVWSTGFDADPQAAEKHLAAMTNFGQLVVGYPVGVASIYQVQGSYNQKLSLTEARKAPLGVDPLFVSSDVQSLVEIIKYQPVKNFRGLQGSRLRFNLRSTSAAPWSTYDLLALIDQSHYRMYTFIIGCSGGCFEKNKSAMDEVINSWRFQK